MPIEVELKARVQDADALLRRLRDKSDGQPSTYRDTYYENPAEGEGPLPVPDATPFLRGTPRAAAPNERGWKDTVRVDPGEITSILVPFGAGAAPQVPFGNSFTGEYVWHCHILEHEDNEMMLRYEVVP